jgi:predicted nuclease of predicted toxin-antitoxin system
MKLLLDQNLSPRLALALREMHPGTVHVRERGLQAAEDAAIWALARAEGFVIVSKDADFLQMSFLFGPPPKVVWVRLGNCSTDQVLAVLLAERGRLAAFDADEDAGLLVLP